MNRLTRLGVMSGLLAVTSAHSPLFAQQGHALETGLAALRFPDDSALVVGPWARVGVMRSGPRYLTALSAEGVVTADAASGSSVVSGTWRAVARPRWALEGSGEGSLILSSVSGVAPSALASVRLIHAIGRGGAGFWLRGSGELARREVGTLPGHGLRAGLWLPIARGLLGASVARQRTEGQLFDANFRTDVRGKVPVRYTEGGVDLQLEGRAGTLALSVGARQDPDAAQRLEPALSASAVLWQTSNRALTVSLARLPADYVHRVDAQQSVSVGMRFGERPVSAHPVVATRPTVLISDQEGILTLRVRAPGARRVEVMGDFTDWEAVELSPVGELFVRAISLAPGTHRLVLRVDGGEWLPAANTPAVDDDLGGRMGLLVVP